MARTKEQVKAWIDRQNKIGNIIDVKRSFDGAPFVGKGWKPAFDQYKAQKDAQFASSPGGMALNTLKEVPKSTVKVLGAITQPKVARQVGGIVKGELGILADSGKASLDAMKKKKALIDNKKAQEIYTTGQKVGSTIKRGVEMASGIKPMTPDEAAKVREELFKPRQSIADKIVKGMVNNGMLSQKTVDDINQQMSQNKWFKKGDPLYKRIEDKLKAKGVLK